MSIRFHPRARRPTAVRLRRAELSPEWRLWAARNLLRGAPAGAVTTALSAHGVPGSLARAEVEALARSPLFEVAAEEMRAARQKELVLRLLDTLSASRSAAIERRSAPPAGEFYERYFATHTPVILIDLLRDAPARERWTPHDFRERFADVELAITDGREGDPDYDRNTPRHTRAMRMADYVDRVLAAGVTNDFYMVANNRNLSNPALAPLLDEIPLPDGFLDPALFASASALWFGPAGTVTPLHHDTSSILFCQLHGRKRWRLISPLATALFDHARSLYSTLDPEDPASESVLAGARMLDCVLEPGETLFVPACYWHHVRALDVSISFATTALARPNNFEWFRPAGP